MPIPIPFAESPISSNDIISEIDIHGFTGSEVPKGNEQGVLKLVAKPKDEGPQLKTVDIIAVNCGGSGWKEPWTDPTSGYFWLEQAIPLLPGGSTAYVYSYSIVGNPGWDDAKDNLIKLIIANRTMTGRSDTPLIFIGLGLGGTLIKQVFISTSPGRTSDSQKNELHANIAGIVFMGTRHQGSFDKSHKLSTLFSRDIIQKSSSVERQNVIMRGLNQYKHSIIIPKSSGTFFSQALLEVAPVNTAFELMDGQSVPYVNFFERNPTQNPGSSLPPVSPDEAAVPKNWETQTNYPLDLPPNTSLGQFREDDENFFIVLKGLASLLHNAPQPRAYHIADLDTTKRCILSLDGGGVRGLFSVIVLEALMAEVCALLGHASDIKPCDFFDLVGGTSTGGLLAIMLVRLRMDLPSCKQEYRRLSRIIFPKPRFPLLDGLRRLLNVTFFGGSEFEAGPYEKAIKEVIASRINRTERLHLKNPQQAFMRTSIKPKSLCFACTIKEGHEGCICLRSYDTTRGLKDPNVKIWQACRATSAAQTYFPPMVINGVKYWDGGSYSNNPIVQTYTEAWLQFGQPTRAPPIAAIVSIGTGKPTEPRTGTTLIPLFEDFMYHSTDTERAHEEFKGEHPDLNYFRFQGPEELGSIDLSDYEKLDTIEDMAEDFVKSHEEEIKNCALKLVPLAKRAFKYKTTTDKEIVSTV